MKYMFAAAVGILLTSGPANAEITAVCLKNASASDKQIWIEEVDNYDWEGVDRPDHNWHGTSIKAGETRCEWEVTNSRATSPRFVFVIGGGRTEMKFVFDNDIQLPADELWGVRTDGQPSDPLRGYSSSKANPNYEFGQSCTGEFANFNCGIFTITGP